MDGRMTSGAKLEASKDRFETWDPKFTYVVGHQRPDTDAISSALGYAWFLSANGQKDVQALRAGQTVEQTRFALRRFNQTPPRLMADIAPTFAHVARKQTTVRPDAPLSEAIAHLAAGAHVVPVMDGEDRPLGVVTPLALARACTVPGGGGPNPFAQPCRKVAEKALTFKGTDRISDHRSSLLRNDVDDFLVLSDDGGLLGVATRRRILEPPRAKLILVDHNELQQAVAGADEAEIVAVLDHHRLGNAPTAMPIPFVVEPVGSTCTLVAEHCRLHKLEPPASIAGMMLSGILSDTLVFRSPTTTDRDKEAGMWLARLSDTDIVVYGDELLRAAPGLSGRDADEIVDADRKTYEVGGTSISIAQVEVTGLQELPQRRDELLVALKHQREREGLALACLMVTDVVLGFSHLLCEGESWIRTSLPFARIGEHEFDLEGIVSRKKQLVPTLVAVLEEAR